MTKTSDLVVVIVEGGCVHRVFTTGLSDVIIVDTDTQDGDPPDVYQAQRLGSSELRGMSLYDDIRHLVEGNA